jgi:nitroimidazol reductase NimA-like FMN-containing flavoprotein (pyridoxamine 5'-phosphate oxidase superfamily)
VSTHDARTGIEWLDRQECLNLLAGDQIGRLAVLEGGTPVIFPVNYGLDGTAIVIRTDPGTKLDDGPRSRACFEIDSFDRETKSGWSVVAVGRLEEVSRYDSAHERVQGLPVEPWAGGEKAHWLRLVPDRITGRRLPRVTDR